MKRKAAIALLAFAMIGACTRRPNENDDHCRFEDKYRQARKSTLEADADITKGDLVAANVVLKRALADFDYTDPNVLDDTGLHLILAEPAERRGDLKLAVTIRRRILGERMDTYKWRHPTLCPVS